MEPRLHRMSRYLHKNSGFVRELVANMAIYSTGDGTSLMEFNQLLKQFGEMRKLMKSPHKMKNRFFFNGLGVWTPRC